MKRSLKAIVAGLALILAGNAAHAMSELASITVTPLWPTNSHPGNLLLYEVVVERQGAGLLEVEFSAGDFPEGCQVSFSRGSIRLVGNDPRYVYFTMSIMGEQPTATDRYLFTVTGQARRETVTFTNVPSTALRLGSVPSLLVSAALGNGGDIEIRGLGDSGQSYQIEATSTLVNPAWGPVGDCTADGNGRFIFTHSGAVHQGAPMLFYRAVRVVPAN